MKFSVIIPYSMDYPHVWFTVQDKFLRLDEYPIEDYEVIIVENGSIGEHLRLVRRLAGKQGENPNEWFDQQSSWMAPRRRNLHYIEQQTPVYMPNRLDRPTQLHSKPAINMGAWRAKGEYLVFMDSHVLLNDNWFQMAEKHMDDHPECTILHSSVSWHNRNPVDGRRGYQYNLTFNENEGHLWGNWSASRVSDTPYRIAASGYCSVVVRRDEFINKYKGFPSMLRAYGAGEPYLDILAWMMGDEVHLHPDMHTIHFSLTSGRGYYQGGVIVMNRNKALATYILGGEKWLMRLYDENIEQHGKTHPDWIPKFQENVKYARKWGKYRRAMVEEKAIYTLEDIFPMFKAKGVYF